MTSLETSGPKEKQTPDIIEVHVKGIHDVTLRLVGISDLPDLKALFEKNKEHFAKGGILYGTYEIWEQEILNGKHAGVNRRFGIYHHDNLIGFVSATSYVPSRNDVVELACGIDSENAGLGIATAAVKAVADKEVETNHTIVFEINEDNYGSQAVVKKLGAVANKRRVNEPVVYVINSNKPSGS